MSANGTSNGSVNGTNGTSDALPGNIPLIINNKPHTTSKTHPVISPLNSKQLYTVSVATPIEADLATRAASDALPGWRSTPASERRRILHKTADILASKRDEQFKNVNRETACPAEMFGFEFHTMIEHLRHVAGLIEVVSKGEVPDLGDGKGAMIFREPIGAILAIGTWNAANVLGGRSFIGPIAMGNTVVLKGPENAPLTYQLLVSSFHEAGLPPGVLNLLFVSPQTAPQTLSHLIKSPAIRKINFTGSGKIGSIIAEQAGKALKPCILELGGKAPAIVCEDADLQLAARECAMSAFLNGGQICMSSERILVRREIVKDFEEMFRKEVEKLHASQNGLATLNSAMQVDKTTSLLKDAKTKGARIIHGEIDKRTSQATQMSPVILGNVTKEMDIYYTESFGPCVSIIEINSDQQGIDIANDTEYGLSSAVFSKDLGRALKIAKGIESGAVHINSGSVYDNAQLAHGGVKSSGFGRFNDVEGLREWVRTKSVTWAS